MVWNGAIMENSAQAARLSLYSNCSLGIRNIVAEDAGLYWCWSGNTTAQDTIVGLHILNSEYLDCNDSELGQISYPFLLFDSPPKHYSYVHYIFVLIN